MGWSWGTSIMGLYTSTHNDKVDRLVLYAPQWLSRTPALIGGSGPVAAYRSVSRDSARERWLTGVAADKRDDLIPPGWFLHAEWDADLPSYMSHALFKKLTGAPDRRFVELGEGTHTVMMEKNRMQFLHAVAAFLTEADPQALN